jgi:hypothetical protein
MVLNLVIVYFIIGFAIANAATVCCREASMLFGVRNGLDFWILSILWPLFLVMPCIMYICSLPVWLLDKWVKLLRS